MAYTAITAPVVGDSTKQSLASQLVDNDAHLLSDRGAASVIKTLSNESYTILDDDGFHTFILSATALTAERTLTLPTAADNTGRRIRVITKNAHGTYKLVVDGEGAETINGYAAWNLNGIYQRVDLISDGTEWLVEFALGELITLSDTSDYQQLNPTNFSWYNLGSLSFTLGPGRWVIDWRQAVQAVGTSLDGARALATISTSSSSESDDTFTMVSGGTWGSAGGTATVALFDGHIELSIAASTTYYLLQSCFVTPGSGTLLQLLGNSYDSIVRARRIA